jgi:hypothetical protein
MIGSDTFTTLQSYTMSTSSRAASAATSRKAKDAIVKLLFGEKYRGKGREAHRMLDSTIYTYSELKRAYRERLQEIHPDKLKHSVVSGSDITSDEIKRIHTRFVELQIAWANYEHVAKMLERVGNASEANFTMFGVGCSFSDSPEERARREEITDQACRGWFSSGALAEESTDTLGMGNSTSSIAQVRLVDDDMFVENQEPVLSPSSLSDATKRPKPSLVPGFRTKQ